MLLQGHGPRESSAGGDLGVTGLTTHPITSDHLSGALQRCRVRPGSASYLTCLTTEAGPRLFPFTAEDAEAQSTAVSIGLVLSASWVTLGRLLALSGLQGSDTYAGYLLGESRFCGRALSTVSTHDKVQ